MAFRKKELSVFVSLTLAMGLVPCTAFADQDSMSANEPGVRALRSGVYESSDGGGNANFSVDSETVPDDDKDEPDSSREEKEPLVGVLVLNLWILLCCERIFGRFLKHFLTGFWYSDSFRVAATLAIAVVPLASVGLATIIRWFVKLAGEKKDVESNGALMLSMLALAFIVLYFPNHEIPKNSYAVTGFGQVSMMLEKGNSLFVNQAPLDSEEIEFAKKAKEIVGNDKVFNIPFDGSAYLYAINDMNVANKRWYGFANDGSDDSVIRNCLNEVDSNPEVDRALRDEGVRYLILLDNGMADGFGGISGDQLHQDEWRGVLSVTDNTPDLKLLLSEDDMRLYEIQY